MRTDGWAAAATDRVSGVGSDQRWTLSGAAQTSNVATSW